MDFWLWDFPGAFLALSLVSASVATSSGASTNTNSLGAAEYNIGDTVPEDITTPIPLVVIDPEDTAALKQKRALRVPVICRYYTNVADEVETEFQLFLK